MRAIRLIEPNLKINTIKKKEGLFIENSKDQEAENRERFETKDDES